MNWKHHSESELAKTRKVVGTRLESYIWSCEHRSFWHNVKSVAKKM